MPSVGNAFISKVGGGAVLTGYPSVLVNDLPIVVVGSVIADHGRNEHSSAKMIVGYPSVLAGDIQICRLGDNASCGHSLISSSNVEAG
jgi:uncharacterized Zn-binding protein involved in type VI secretion